MKRRGGGSTARGRFTTGRIVLIRVLRLPAFLVVCVCCVLPLAWLGWQVVANPSTLRALLPDPFHGRLLARTLGYNGAVALLATIAALPAAYVLGRGRGRLAAALWFALPVALLMPSIAYAYGWSQFLRLLNVTLDPGGAGDVARCVFTLAAWLWPLPAGIVGLALRRTDVNLQQQALLDGALWRVTARQLAGPLAASVACVTVLASQEFAVYEPTGISVVATETRMVYETGLYSSPSNPITAPMSGGTPATDARDATGARDATDAQDATDAPRELGERSAAATATALPMLVVVGALGIATAWGARSLSAAEDLDAGAWPRALDAGRWPLVIAWAVVSVTLMVPTISLVLARLQSPDRPFVPLETLAKFRPQLSGSLILAGLAGMVAGVVACSGTLRGSHWALVASLASFLLGGQLLAIALIRIYNRESLGWVYDGPAIVVMAYLARFGWLALLAAAVTRSRAWRPLREVAAVDGAGDLRTAAHVVWPLAWPLLGASALLVAVLGLTEVPATVLISPLRPQPLIPMLMTWVHMQRYDDMLEASLLLMGIVFVLALIVSALVWGGLRLTRLAPFRSAALVLLPALFVCGCGDPNEPDAIWLRTGAGPGQVVYPRCIDYSARDDTFYVVDRMARVQHIDHDGHYLAGWTMPDAQNGKPTGVTVGPDGLVYLADTHYQRVMVYDPKTGTEVRRWGSQGKGPGEFIYPTDVAFDESGNVFVSEYGDNDRIQVFDTGGRFLYAFGKPGRGPGELARPQSMVIDEGLVYVTDASNHRISVFKTDGTFVRTMGSIGAGLGQFRWPYGLAQDRRGNLVICEFGNNRVQLVDKQTGRGLKVWGMPGRGPGELAYPWAVAVDKRGRIVTVDAGNNRLQVFEF